MPVPCPIPSSPKLSALAVLMTTALATAAVRARRARSKLPLTTLAFTAAVGLTLYDLLGRQLLYTLLNLAVITLGMTVLVAALLSLRMRKLA